MNNPSGYTMPILYCQKMILPNNSAHAIHFGMTAANFAAAGAPTVFFPGVPFSGGRACVEDFFTHLGYAPLPEALHVCAIPFRHKGLYGIGFRCSLWWAMRRHSREGAASICFASSVKEAVMALRLRRLSGRCIPVVFEIHHLISRLKAGAEAEKLYALEREAFSQADMVVFNCETLRAQARGYLPEPKISVISPLGFNERVIRPVRDPERPEPETNSGIVRLAYAGSLQEGKGVENLLHSLAILSARYALTIVGGQPPARLNALCCLAEELKIADRVKFTGLVEQSQVGKQLEGCDIFVIPLSTGEDFFAPLKMYEALGFALPIVATPIPSLRCTLIEGENALFAAGTDPHSLVAAICRLGDDLALRQTMRRSNLNAAQAFRGSARAETLLKTFRQAFGA